MNIFRKNKFVKVNRWIVLGGGLSLSFVLLMLIPEENLVIRNISITLTAVLSIGYYLYERYSNKFAIQSDLLISVNALAQFLLPVFYLAFYYQANSNLDIHGYRYGYAVTSFAVLLGQIMFFIGYESIKKSVYFPPVQISEKSYTRLFLVILPFLIIIWISRIILLSTGSYYHIYRTDYQFTSPFYSVFAQLSEYGLIVVAALFLMAFSEGRSRHEHSKFAIAIIACILELLWYIPSGSREPIAFIILAPIFAYMFIKRKIPKKTIAILVIASFPVLAFLGIYRYVAFSSYQVSKLDLSTVPGALLDAKDELIYRNSNFVADIMDRFYDGKSLGYLLMHYSHDYDYEFGSTYKYIPFSFIPRFIYPDKPVFITPLNNWYKLIGDGTMPTTFWGESYIDFSWFGIIVMSYLLGCGMKWFDYIFIKRYHKPYWVVLYTFGAMHIMRLPVEPLAIWISFLLKVIVLAFIFTKVHSVLTKAAHSSQSTFFVMQSRK